MKQRVLILCTGNSARSQMAEGLLRHLTGDRFEVFSAGSKPSQVNPFAIEAMNRRGIDISGQRSKHLSEYLNQPFDYVITVCDQAAETCPFFRGKHSRFTGAFPILRRHKAAMQKFSRHSNRYALILRRNSAHGRRNCRNDL